MQTIAKFHKVSKKEQFIIDFQRQFFLNMMKCPLMISTIQLNYPKRATIGSAGYDFYTPIDFILKPHETIKIPTGIRVSINDGWVLGYLSKKWTRF